MNQVCSKCKGQLEKERVRHSRAWVCIKCQHKLSIELQKKRNYKNKTITKK